MNSKKLIKVGVSASLIELKAELQRKQNELLSTANTSSRGVVKSLKVKNESKQVKLNSGKNSGVDQRIARDKEEQELESKSYEKAKAILEAKAKLYDQMNSRETLNYDPEEHPVLINSLVDFQQKAIEKIHEEREQLKSLDEPSLAEDSEWTEFTDSLGRTRRCLKVELDEFIARDLELAQQLKEQNEDPENPPPEEPLPEVISPEEEARRAKHQKWEGQAAEVAGKSNVYYQDILYDEIRNHGVGYYEFAKNDEVRAKQLLDLKKMSEQTEEERKKIEKAKRQRKVEIKDRLRKIRQRKRAKLGLPMEDKEESSSSSEEEDDKEKEAQQQQQQSESFKKPMPKPPVRAWDYGKPNVHGPKPDNFDELDAKWLQNRRKDRVSQFAPPKKY